MLRPRRPLIPTQKGQVRGLGAWEAVARVSDLRVGEKVFTAGFAGLRRGRVDKNPARPMPEPDF
jgi:hypothetical protein